jgi:septal ring factor EnvC (AmiA/AmiB activator)
VKELDNEVAELREQADELRLQLKESEARLGAVEDDGREQARTIDMLLAWCQEQRPSSPNTEMWWRLWALRPGLWRRTLSSAARSPN